MEFNVTERDEVGYSKPVFTFSCPLCISSPVQDLDRTYVRDQAWRHLLVQHNVESKQIDLVFIRKDVLEGMSKACSST